MVSVGVPTVDETMANNQSPLGKELVVNDVVEVGVFVQLMDERMILPFATVLLADEVA